MHTKMHMKSGKKRGHLFVDILLLLLDQMSIDLHHHFFIFMAETANDIENRDTQQDHDRGVVMAQVVEAERKAKPFLQPLETGIEHIWRHAQKPFLRGTGEAGEDFLQLGRLREGAKAVLRFGRVFHDPFPLGREHEAFIDVDASALHIGKGEGADLAFAHTQLRCQHEGKRKLIVFFASAAS